MSEITDQIISIEKRFWTEADDPDFFEEHFADEGISVIEPMGFIDKPKAVAMTADKPWQDVGLKDVQVRELTPDCVILAYHGQGRHEGDKEPYRASIASTYVRRDGHWQLALTAHQPWKPAEDTGA